MDSWAWGRARTRCGSCRDPAARFAKPTNGPNPGADDGAVATGAAAAVTTEGIVGGVANVLRVVIALIGVAGAIVVVSSPREPAVTRSCPPAIGPIDRSPYRRSAEIGRSVEIAVAAVVVVANAVEVDEGIAIAVPIAVPIEGAIARCWRPASLASQSVHVT